MRCIRGIKAEATTTSALGLIHCGIGNPHQCVNIHAMYWIYGNTNTAGDIDAVVSNFKSTLWYKADKEKGCLGILFPHKRKRLYS